MDSPASPEEDAAAQARMKALDVLGGKVERSEERVSSPPPPASAFLNKHTHHTDGSADDASAATAIISNITSSIPYKGFGKANKVAPQASESDRPAPFANLRYRLRGIFSPRANDFQQLLIKLQNQSQSLNYAIEQYSLDQDGSFWDEGAEIDTTAVVKASREDPKHPLNNPELMTEVHFVGRKAIDSCIIQLVGQLQEDRFGCITELWLNDNLISDDGAEVLASFLQLPTCALTELWLGNNEIGPEGATLISASLSNNENSKLTCLGLYKNPLGNGGATALAQMLRRNHILSTVDIHGCGVSRSKGPDVLEGYGCKVIKASDGTEYVARVVANTEVEEGTVTDQRLLDAIQTFSAFNRLNPTREQAIRGIMSSNKHIQHDASDKEDGGNTNEQSYQKHVSTFLSELCSRPANEKLTDEEKRTWKDCEWERLYVTLERARAAKVAMANQLKMRANENEEGMEGEDTGVDGEDGSVESEGRARDLDDEVVRTDLRSWQDLKMSITGSTRADGRAEKAHTANKEKLYVIDDTEDETESPGAGIPPA